MYIGFPSQPCKNLKGPTAYFNSSGLLETQQHYHYQYHRLGPNHCFF